MSCNNWSDQFRVSDFRNAVNRWESRVGVSWGIYQNADLGGANRAEFASVWAVNWDYL